MRVLVTGAGGFAGGHLARRLASDGFDVVALTRKSAVQPPESAFAARHFSVLEADLTSGRNLPADCDAIIHTAATSPWSGVTVDDMVRDNVCASQRLIRHAIGTGVKSFIFYSSMSAFGRITASVANESLPIVDPDPYGATKLLSEQMLADASCELNSIALRLPGVIGRASRRNWLSESFRTLKASKPLTYRNPDAAFNNAVHEQDLSQLIGHLLESGVSGHDMIVLGADSQMPVGAIVDRMVETTNSASVVEVQKNTRPSFTIDSSKARNSHGYDPMPIETMIEQYIQENL